MAKSDLILVGFDSAIQTIHQIQLFDIYLAAEVEAKLIVNSERHLLLIEANFTNGHLYQLDIDYSTRLSNDSSGFYYVKYENENGNYS